MVRIIKQRFGNSVLQNKVNPGFESEVSKISAPLSRNAKFLAWSIFLIFFIENGTLGLIPKQFYFVFRNIRLSDFIMYAVIIYSLFCIKEYTELYYSRSLLIMKFLLLYLVIVFIGSTIVYNYNPIELFFRLKQVWASFLLFPYLLLFKRNALQYLIRIIFPFAVISNILYIFTSLSGVALLPDVTVVKQTLPGGFQIYRVFGGTFYGDMFFLGYIFFWITNKFKPYQLLIVALFVLPHILAFGRGAWIFFVFVICMMFLWNILKKKNFKVFLRQLAIILILLIAVFYILNKFIPESENITDALESRMEQGKTDYQYGEGTLGTRYLNTEALVNLWLNSNLLYGIGMHPMWVISPVTEEERIYYWGFSDLRGVGVLAAYGLIGFLLYAISQLYYGFLSFKILKHTQGKDLFIMFIILILGTIIFATFSYHIFFMGLFGPSFNISFYIAVLVYKYEHS